MTTGVKRQESLKVETKEIRTSTKAGFPKRYIVVLLCLLATMLQYVIRVNFSVTIVAMVNKTSVNRNEPAALTNITSSGCPVPRLDYARNATSTAQNKRTDGQFDWSPSTQGIILGAFYYGYVLTHINGGQLADLCGSKLVIGFSLLTSGLFTLLTPLAAHFHVTAVIFLRIVTGMSQGVLSPAIYTLYGKWIPPTERGTAIAYFNVGANGGTVITMPMSGYLSDSTFLGGWPSVFYVSGTAGVVCFLLWTYCIYDSPEKHPSIKDDELVFIKSQLNSDVVSAKKKQIAKVPWLKIFLCRHMWIIAFVKFACGWASLLLMSKLPAYLESVHHLDLQTNGIINASLYIAICVSVTTFGYLSDFVIRKKWLNLTTSRKIFESFAVFSAAACISAIPLCGCQTRLVVGLLIGSMVFLGAQAGGDQPIVMDIAPDYSGSLYGITNAIGSLPGFVAPIVVGLLIDSNPGSIEMWSYVFYITSLLLVFGGVSFLFVSAEEQSWGKIQATDSKPRSKKESVNGDVQVVETMHDRNSNVDDLEASTRF